MINFNKPPVLGTELGYISEIINANGKLCGDGNYSKRCEAWLEQPSSVIKALLTPSCTAALEMTALLIDIHPGDEVIMPSYTFVSTANAFVLRGAKIVFVDIRPDTMNIDEKKIEAAITPKTKAIVPVHYAGVACEMDAIMALANRYNLYVIEDAAQGVMATYKGRQLGSIGHLGCYSFHETKNYTSGGEGGALLINDERFVERAEVIREKGTNRSQFLRGQVDKYTWRDIGSSFLPSELQAAYLLAQLEAASQINEKRLALWHQYHEALESINELIHQPHVPSECVHNAHMYYIKLDSLTMRDTFIDKMKAHNIQTPFHYVPLHSSPAGLKYGRFSGKDEFTTTESEKLVRLPLWFNLTHAEAELVVNKAITSLREL
ncbi:dTDP-4-amino-4,6-dideoxygalactose transaminase [Legionella hackeliae]|uniref:Lipopolysaccharide biosynthesis protein rffA n=1 Tax=Legionella hackeliae TaxID=449 RepID=A0A0A8UT45_LEGHA|nr:dTDP-4-amino-4,6-dideoxygalactose transaminase [Legionella hackeliae]KTD08829.1 aminotransferase WecE [Legionella hackeliae]CEK10257.1 Lipopolysaccharide biosynthesis protein rffA [Legionella hackeliae]STX46986.1 aminotransferase [Legionella hackeliae]